MPDESNPTDGGPRLRWYQVVSVGAVTVAFVGFFVGTQRASYEEATEAGFAPESEETSTARSDDSARAAPSYGELQKSEYDKNPQWKNAIDQHRRSSPDDWRPKTRARETNRAYDGAPPTVPHPVRERSAEACLTCHGEGVRVGGRNGPKMSHEYLTECVQCHASSSPKRPFQAEAPASVSSRNRFQPIEASVDGPRSYGGAPPRIPHRTQMRTECSSCHGEFGRPGPPSHGELPECRQCHADDAGLPVGDGPPATVSETNRFAGLDDSSLTGDRAWEGAPPQIPHATEMRENCMSCHGPAGESAIKTTSHPWRQECVQCHAPSGRHNLRPPGNRLPFLEPGDADDARGGGR